MSTYSPSKLTLCSTLCLLAICGIRGAVAAPVTITDAFDSARHFGPSVFGPANYSLEVGADITPAGGVTTATATHGTTVLPLNFTGNVSEPDLYGAGILFSSTLTGTWTITAQNGTNIATATTNPISSALILPLVNNLTAAGPVLDPTLTWTLPNLSGLGVNTNLVTVFSDSHGPSVVALYNLDGVDSSFTIPGGVLSPGISYVFDVTL